MVWRLLLAWCAGLFVACGGEDSDPPLSFPNEPGGNPLVPQKGLYPFPSDFYLEADDDTVTGRRLAVPQEAVPNPIVADAIVADGFSMMPQIVVALPGGIALDTLPDPRDTAATTRDDAPVFLVNASTGERVAALAELDLHVVDPAQQAMLIRPHLKLEPNTGYVVILRNSLRTADGAPHTPSDAFRALRDGIATDEPTVEAQRQSFELVNETIIAQGLNPEEVVLAWSFHTRSEEDVVTAFVAMQQMAWSLPAGNYTITEEITDDENNRIINGLFETPNFRNVDGYVELDADGLPIQQGTYEEEFRITIPESVDETRPVIVYGHGFLGSYDQSSRGAVNQLCRERRFSTVASTLGFNSEDEGRIISILGGDPGDMHWLVSLNWQKTANFTVLAKLTRDKLAAEITADKGAGEFTPLDPDNIHYSGISNGGTFGYLIAATSPAFRRANLIVGGGGLTHFLQRAVQWNEFKPLFGLIYPDPLELQGALSLLQMAIDPIDPINYAHRLVVDRFPNLQPMKAASQMAVNDSQVRNLLTEWTARTAGQSLVTPSAKDVWGLPTVDGADVDSVDGALFVYDEKLEPSPVTNLPPEEDNDTHGTATHLGVFQEHWYELIENGRFVYTCDGACDPQ